ncbi:MAG: DEAD/DEAH box helicase [Chitinophagales bacterium]|nr:DEAD/DEAH box helicase [Chitinophagales bacterium]MCZ2394798.1 DEAD/DEAH box helicase [Chitinophagales bacterium]
MGDKIGFSDLGLHQTLLKALADAKYIQPTDIQLESIPLILNRNDVLGCAQTGTGKTAAFILPILHQILTLLEQNTIQKKELKCIVLVPTRELALQINEYVAKMVKYSNIRHCVVFGGIDIDGQIQQLKKIHPQILIATPGRLLDIYRHRFISFKHAKFLVLDEADRMLDLGFKDDLHQIIDLLPKARQTLMFSATLNEKTKILAKNILREPTYIKVSPAASTSFQVKQYLYPVATIHKNDLVIHLIKKMKPKSMVIFTKTKAGANQLVKELEKVNIKAEALHSDRSQQVRIRILAEFAKKKLNILVATDVAARGLDIEGIDYVVNFDVPLHAETYVHRVGRTGRAEAKGKAFTFVTPEDWNLVEKIQDLTKENIPFETGHPYTISLNFTNQALLEQPIELPQPPVKKKKPTSKERRAKKALQERKGKS